jgi:tRNA (guanine37-N1)-methyltransferase
MIEFDILTLFPRLCEGAFSESILGKAQENHLIRVRCLDLRQWAAGKHRVTDEPPYGGGPGMVMKAEPIFAAVEAIRRPESHVILMSATGERFTQRKARELAAESHLIFVCGHYEGVDQRVADHLVDEELSIGDYILTNGAITATVVVDAVARLIPGVLGEADSATEESFSNGLLEYPHYTRPAEFRGLKVPEILLSGNHAAIEAWRKAEALKRTVERRPDLTPGTSGNAGSAGSASERRECRELDRAHAEAFQAEQFSEPGSGGVASSRSAVNEES